jgi:tetratricopeptide (TPR) repeat protein
LKCLGDSYAFKNRGNCLSKLNRLDEAIASYDMAIRHNPTDSYAFNGKGKCLKDLNRLEEALAAIDMAIKHKPTYSIAINNRKIILEKL